MREAKYKVGHSVMIRPDLKRHTAYNGINTNADMAGLGGKIFTVTRVTSGVQRNMYSLKNSPWSWTEEMFVPVDKDELLKSFINGNMTKKQYESMLKAIDADV